MRSIVNEKLIFTYSTIFVIKTQRIFLRYFPVIKILRFDLNSAQLTSVPQH